MISMGAFLSVSCCPIEAKAYPIELSASYSRQFISTQFEAIETWREASFIYTPSLPLSVPMSVSFTCSDNYGEELEKWVSIYDSNGRLCYDSGWVFNINSQSVRSPFIGGSSSMHVFLRVRYKGGEVPLTPNMFQGATFILDVTRREEVTQPYGWNETTTVSLPTTVTFPTTSVTAPELEDIPLQVVSHADLFARLFGLILAEGDLLWIVGASLILSFGIWLLYGK